MYGTRLECVCWVIYIGIQLLELCKYIRHSYYETLFVPKEVSHSTIGVSKPRSNRLARA